MTGAKSKDPLYIDYIPTIFAFLPVAGACGKWKSGATYGRSQEGARNQDKKKEKKTSLTKDKAMLEINAEDKHSVPDYIKYSSK